MHKAFKTISFLICGFSAFYGRAQNDTTYYNKTWKKTTKDSASYYRTVEKQADGKFFVKDHYLNGKVQMSGYYSCADLNDSCENGHTVFYDSLGNKEEEGIEKNGKRDGTWKAYSKNNNVLFIELNYKNDTVSGHMIVYDTLLRYKKMEGNLSKGKRNGTWRSYWPDGTPKTIENYRDDIRIGINKVFDPASNSNVVIDYKNGIPETSTVIQESHAGLNAQHMIYYDSVMHKKILEGDINYQGRTGKWIGYYTNGAKSCILNYNNGDFDGVEIWYYKNGAVKRKSDYKKGKLVTGKCFNEKGKQISYNEN